MAHEDLWRATVTFDSTAPLTHDQANTLCAALPGPSVTVEQDGRGTHLSMTVPAVSLAEAVEEARLAVHEAYRSAFDVVGRQVAIAVQPEAVYREELIRPSPMALIGVGEIGDMAGVSRERGRQLTELPDFPPPLAVVKATKVYTRLSVELFLQRWPRRAGWNGHHAQAERGAATSGAPRGATGRTKQQAGS